MKSLKMVMIAITAFTVVALSGCSESIKVPDISVLRIAVTRISTKNIRVAEQYCRWRFYATKGITLWNSVQECVHLYRANFIMVPISLMQWKEPTTYDTDRCPLNGKLHKRCKKVVKIFLMWLEFNNGGSYYLVHSGNIVDSDNFLQKEVGAFENGLAHSSAATTIGVKSVLAWAHKMNKLAETNPPRKPVENP